MSSSVPIIPIHTRGTSPKPRVEEERPQTTDFLLDQNHNHMNNKNNNNTSPNLTQHESKRSHSPVTMSFIDDSPKTTYLGQAERINIENDRVQFFSGLKSNLQADLGTFWELVLAIGYAIYGITVSIIISLIPRRFRYKSISGQVVLITG